MLQSIFYFLSFTAIFCGLMVILSKNPIHSVLFLVMTFFALTGHYILLNAQFIAIVNIIVYAGAIMVLFLFVIMLLNLNAETEPLKSNVLKFIGVLAGGSLMIVLIAALKNASLIVSKSATNNELGMVKTLGLVLYKDYLMPFEVASILLLVAMVGAVILSKNDPKSEIEIY
jgi:NADH-quinone oxidoreductase subunit J